MTAFEAVRQEARLAVDPHGRRNDTDYIFITFILNYLPHGLLGLLIATFFAAALSAKAAELNALGSATTVDFYRHVIRPAATTHIICGPRGGSRFFGVRYRSRLRYA